jgi:hypothetical protein
MAKTGAMGPGIFRSPGVCTGRARRLRAVACAALACLALVPAAAAAQSAGRPASANSEATLLVAGTVASSTDMNFGTIAVTTAGTVKVSAAASPTCITTGVLVRTGPCTAATFEGRVRWLFPLQITPPSGGAINLTGPGGATMVVDNFTFGPGPGLVNWGANRFLILNFNGSYSFYAGATLHVAANQTPGTYSGTFQIMLNYD